MTVRDELRQIIDRLSDEQASELLDEIRWMLLDEETLPAEQLAEVLEGKAEIARGEWVDWDDLRKQLNL